MGATQHLWLVLDLSQTNRRLWGGHTTTRQTNLPLVLFSFILMSPQFITLYLYNLHYYVNLSSHFYVPVCASCSLRTTCSGYLTWWGMTPAGFTNVLASLAYNASSLARIRCCSAGQEQMSSGYSALKDWTSTLALFQFTYNWTRYYVVARAGNWTKWHSLLSKTTVYIIEIKWMKPKTTFWEKTYFTLKSA